MTKRPTHPHGTFLRYNAGCRCDQCRAANTKRVIEATERRRDTPTDEIPHGRGGYDSYGCRCGVCNEAKLASTAEYSRRAQAESLAGAKKRGQEWTGPELEIAARKDLTMSQVAEMLGRTVRSVRWIRTRLNHEPELRRLAGLRSNDQSDA